MLKVGLVGVGGMGSVHLKNWRAMEGVQLTAICDIRHDLLKEKADREKLYPDFDEMLENESFDIIDVCTPSYLHKEHSIKALKRGIHVLTEKPAALHPEDVREMYRTAEEHHVKLMVAHVIRFMKDYQILKEICRTKNTVNCWKDIFGAFPPRLHGPGITGCRMSSAAVWFLLICISTTVILFTVCSAGRIQSARFVRKRTVML